MARYGEQDALFSADDYRVGVELTEAEREAAEEKALEADRMEAFERQIAFGQGVLETVGV